MQFLEVRKRFIDFFTTRGHILVPSSSLVPEKHPSLLFTNSGMVQFTPYFLGDKDSTTNFGSQMLCSVQKCIRTGDLDIVGKSPYHHSFFEMLGSWSIGTTIKDRESYFKEKAVELAFDLITNKEYGYGIDPSKLIATVFEGNDECPEDSETIKAWKKVGFTDKQISKLPASENWWAPAGLTGPGPCGPCTEVLLDRGDEYGSREDVPGMTDNPRYLEFWNAGVFMQFNRDNFGKLHELPAKSVDTGAGLERFTTLMQNKKSNYETDAFTPILDVVKDLYLQNKSNNVLDLEHSHKKEHYWRIADHLKASSFMIADGVYPSNKDQGYVLRKLIRRVFNDFVWGLNISSDHITDVVKPIREMYQEFYPEIKSTKIEDVLKEEVNTFKKVADTTRIFINKNFVKKGVSEIKNPFWITQTTGAPLELIKDLVSEANGLTLDDSTYKEDYEKHQELSKSGAGNKFKGGLTGDSEYQTKLHTATHLLQYALRQEFGGELHQMGSNITNERLRFDFNLDRKMTDQEVKDVETKVNEIIAKEIPVNVIEMTKEEAEKSGALHFFGEKYGDKVTIYYIGENIETAISKEFCGGPHVENTKDLVKFKILKEEAVAKGVRRIKAVVE